MKKYYSFENKNKGCGRTVTFAFSGCNNITSYIISDTLIVTYLCYLLARAINKIALKSFFSTTIQTLYFHRIIHIVYRRISFLLKL